jgi:hypothetical protein
MVLRSRLSTARKAIKNERRHHQTRQSPSVSLIRRDRIKDIEALADKIAVTIELCNRDGALVRLDPEGKLLPVNLATLRSLIDQSIAGVRLMNCGTAHKPN